MRKPVTITSHVCVSVNLSPDDAEELGAIADAVGVSRHKIAQRSLLIGLPIAHAEFAARKGGALQAA